MASDCKSMIYDKGILFPIPKKIEERIKYFTHDTTYIDIGSNLLWSSVRHVKVKYCIVMCCYEEAQNCEHKRSRHKPDITSTPQYT